MKFANRILLLNGNGIITITSFVIQNRLSESANISGTTQKNILRMATIDHQPIHSDPYTNFHDS